MSKFMPRGAVREKILRERQRTANSRPESAEVREAWKRLVERQAAYEEWLSECNDRAALPLPW